MATGDMLIIDSDAHVVEARDIFTSQLPRRYGSSVPHVRLNADTGSDFWYVGDKPIQRAAGSSIVRGSDRGIQRTEHFRMATRYDDIHPSAYDPHERVKVMDSFGIAASTTYPWVGLTTPDVYREIPDATLDFQMQVMAVYNDWILSWATAEPGRFIPLACIPYWDVPSAVREIERCAGLGIKGLVMSGRPHIHGCPYLSDRSYDPIWEAAQAAGLSISFHAAGGGTDDTVAEGRVASMAQDLYRIFATTADFLQNATAAIDLILSGILHRYPRLNFAIVESGVGWVPFALETLDEHYKRYKPWESVPELSADFLPSEVFRRQVYVNIWYETAMENFPLRNLMFETDYPHPTCLLKDDIDVALTHKLSGLSPEVLEDVLWKNAFRCFQLNTSDVRGADGQA